MPPLQAWPRAQRPGRSGLRPQPPCPWWPSVWSERVPLKVAVDGTVPGGTQRLKVAGPPGPKGVRCQPPEGPFSILAAPPTKDAKPLVLLRYGPSQ